MSKVQRQQDRMCGPSLFNESNKHDLEPKQNVLHHFQHVGVVKRAKNACYPLDSMEAVPALLTYCLDDRV